MRERVTATAILSLHGRGRHASLASLAQDDAFARLDIYEPGVAGPYRPLFGELPRYRNSFYWEGAEPGELRNGVPHQDLMALSFDDASFDLVISSDIFEHVRKPKEGFAEIRRVLRPGGAHIFSLPSLVPMPPSSVDRVDTSGDTDVHVLEPRYHGDGRGGKSLVYTDFGSDLFDLLEEVGFQTLSVRDDHTDPERMRVNAFIAIAR